MNNAKIIETLSQTPEVDIKPLLREHETKIAEIIDALQHIGGSNYWIVLQKEFADDLRRLESQLETEEDTVKIFRLQGEIKALKKLDLQKMLREKRKELELIRKKLK